MLLARLRDCDLTRRQAEVALHVARGLGLHREIAERLCVSEQTVKDHLREVYGKVGVRSRSELAARVLGGYEAASSPPVIP